MRFATRTFLWSFLPIAFLLLGAFWAIQNLAQHTVRDGLRSSLRQTQLSIARVRSKSELQNSRFLKILGENASLKAGLQLLLADPKSGEARLTVEDQLRETCDALGFDFLLASDPNGAPLAGVMRIGEQLAAMDISRVRPPLRGFTTVEERAYQVASTPINQNDNNIGVISVGERFDFSDFTTPAVLSLGGKVLKSSIPAASLEEVESALKGCEDRAECEVKLRGETYISLPMQSIYFGQGYVLRSLQSVDSASGPVQAILRNVFLVAGVGALAAAMILSVLSSRSIVKPISTVVTRLRESEKTGLLLEFHSNQAPIQEIRDLMESFNRAAVAIREGKQNLYRAYVEFVGSLASALDARDRYTAGHSRRVSECACAMAAKLNLAPEELEQVRIGALLHDIGKIGIADSVLQKPGRLNKEEMALIQQHPTIGRRILEGVQGFQEYLPTVELHHENWNGTGYPLGLRGDATPLAARIVRVADAWDAMTTNRPYRPAMSKAQAFRVIEENAGIQFDPALVPVFTALIDLDPEMGRTPSGAEPEPLSIQNLTELLNGAGAKPVQQPSERLKQ